jgi:hypothetical protein
MQSCGRAADFMIPGRPARVAVACRLVPCRGRRIELQLRRRSGFDPRDEIARAALRNKAPSRIAADTHTVAIEA